MKALHISNLGKMLFLPILMVMLALTTMQAQAPANDLCENATLLTCGQTVTASTLNATIDQAPACGLNFPRFGVWYRLVGAGDLVTLSTCGGSTNYDTQIGVYSGSCTSLVCVAGNDNFCGRQSTVSFTAAAGTTYYIWVTGAVDSRGTFTLSASCTPANDDCANATTISCGQTVTGSTANATGNDIAPTCTTTFTTTMRGLWYNLTPTVSGNTTISLCGSGYDTKLGVFTGACGALTCVAGNDDFCGLQSQVTFNATAGTTYRILVSGFSATSVGNFTLAVTCATAPPPPPPVCSCNNTAAFGTITAPSTPTPVNISTCNYAGEYATINSAVAGRTYVFTSSVATDYLTVRQGTPGGTVLGCGTTPLTVTATAAGALYLHINTNSACGTQNTCRTTTAACSSCSAPPPSTATDACGSAPTITCGTTFSGTTVGATVDGPGTNCATGSTLVAPDVWVNFVGTGQSVTASLCGSSYDTRLDVYTGACGSLTCVVGNDDFCGLQSQVTWTALAGVTYRIRIHGFSGNTGAYTFALTCSTTLTAPTPTNDALIGEVVGLPEGNLTVGQVFPNPLVGNSASIRVDSPKETEAIIRFMDQMGREVMFIESDLNVGDNLLQLNVSRLPAGTYFVMIQVEGKVIPRRLVVPRA